MANMNQFNPNASDPNDPGNPPPGTPFVPPPGASMGAPPDDFDPSEYMINYNERFRNADPALFRDEVVRQTSSCLISKYKPNALLIGPAGGGKTKIAEEIARRIAVNDPSVPDRLVGFTVWELPLSNLVAGSSLVGQLESKVKEVLAYAKDPKNKVILFIDEIHMMVDDGHETYTKIAQIMKPALARGDIRVIGATTNQEAQALMDDPAFNRRFTRLLVDELSKEQTETILQSIQIPMFEHYDRKIALNDKILHEIVSVADEFRTMGSHRPDNAITLLDRSMADAYIQRKQLEMKAKTDPSIAQILAAVPSVALSKSQMRQTAMKIMTGNNKKDDLDPDALRSALSVIHGQDGPLDEMMGMIERHDLNLDLDDARKPLAFLLAGDSGVGKTEAVKIIAKTVTGVKPIILNMTEFHSPASINRIIGAPAGYVGYDSKGELPFDILETNPHQVILLDEFEKADRSVQRLFMSALDEGFIKTARGKIVDFSRSIIVATTNAGHTNHTGTLGFTQGSTKKTSTAAAVSALTKAFDPELLNRFTKVMHFNSIDKDMFREILASSYARSVAKVKASRSSYAALPGLPDALDDATLDALTEKNFIKEFGARPVARVVKTFIEDAILDGRKAAKAAALQAAGPDGDPAPFPGDSGLSDSGAPQDDPVHPD